jgi:hypothetical protein
MFLAVASGGQIAYSFNGVTWTSGTNPQASNQWYDVIWSNQFGQFLIFGITGTARVMSSRFVRPFAPSNHMDYVRFVNITTTTAFTLNDNQRFVTLVKTTGGAMTCTIPENSTFPTPIGFQTKFVQNGTDAIIFAPVSGTVQIRSRSGFLSTSGNGAVAYLEKIGTNEWILSGDLA